jgi:predicted aconitase with swiveling domain
MAITLRCHRGIGPAVEGTALVADDNFSARYDLDRKAGVFSRPAHALHGESYADKILVLQTAKGGVASAWMLRDMVERGITPKALVFNTVNPILAQGAAFGNLTLVDRFEDGDVTKLIRTGDTVRIEAETGTVTILNRS